MEFIIPSFTEGKKKLSAKVVEVSRQTVSVCIHVECVIGLIKNRYKVLYYVLLLKLLKTLSEEGVECEIANIDKLFTVFVFLVNLVKKYYIMKRSTTRNKNVIKVTLFLPITQYLALL